MITSWKDQDTGRASGVPPDFPILVVDVEYTVNAGADSWQTVVYVAAPRD